MEIKEMKIRELEKDLVRLDHEKLSDEARSAAVLCNRHLLELGLRKMYPKKSLTAAYIAFRDAELLQYERHEKRTFCSQAKGCYMHIATAQWAVFDVVFVGDKLKRKAVLKQGRLLLEGAANAIRALRLP